MKIQDEVIEPYEIWQDTYNFSVGVPYTNKAGDINLTSSNHFTTLSGALKDIVKRKLVKEDVVLDIKGYLNRYEEITNEITDKIKI